MWWNLVGAACIAALGILILRLAPGRTRRPPVLPLPEDHGDREVSVVLATYNEAERIAPCLAGLMRQGPTLREVIVVDSHSSDGTRDLVLSAASRDPRIRLVTDPPLPPGWVGKVWALQHGLGEASGSWVLGVDADTEPMPGMVAAVVRAANDLQYDVVSFAPRFDAMTTAEQWLQPSMLLTLVYRFGAAGAEQPPAGKVMANGQCFLAKREVLLAHGGYSAARASWADDVTLARSLAAHGMRVGFLDGSQLYTVRAYNGIAQMWREWGRSFDLSDATTRGKQVADVAFISVVQGLPLPLMAAHLAGLVAVPPIAKWPLAAIILIRLLMLGALRASYARRSVGYWLSPLSDPLAAVRLLVSSLKRPRAWRGRAAQLDAPPM